MTRVTLPEMEAPARVPSGEVKQAGLDVLMHELLFRSGRSEDPVRDGRSGQAGNVAQRSAVPTAGPAVQARSAVRAGGAGRPWRRLLQAMVSVTGRVARQRLAGRPTEMDEEMLGALVAAADLAVGSAQQYEQSAAREAWLRAESAVTAGLLDGADPARTMQGVVDAAAEISGCAVLLIGSTSDLVARAVSGAGSGDLLGCSYRLLEPARAALAAGEPVQLRSEIASALQSSCPDSCSAAARGGHGLTGVPGGAGAVLAPLVTPGNLRGVLLLRCRDGDRAVPEGVGSFARHAAITLEFAHAARMREQLAVCEDRDRIARDLHDVVIQRLFATGLGLQAVAPEVHDRTAVERLLTCVEDLDATIHDVRRAIFSLQQPEEDAGGLSAEIRRCIEKTAPALGYTPRLTLCPSLGQAVPPAVGRELVAVLNEALSNVVRHSRATAVDVEVGVEEDATVRRLLLRVSDNGVGIPSGVPRGRGTRNMPARAALLGGGFGLARRSGGGTMLTWSVPVESVR